MNRAQLDEEKLLNRLKAGDHQAFEQVYHLYKVRLIASMLRILKSEELVEEVIQELFIKIWEQREHLDASKSLAAFIYKIAHNLAYDSFRKIAKDKRLLDGLMSSTIESYDHIERDIFQKESNAELKKAIDLLPPQQKQVFVLCKIEEKSYAEVSVLLDITVGTVNNHMTRANRFLRDYLSNSTANSLCTSLILSAIISGIK